MSTPFIVDDTVVFGILAACLGFVFYTSNSSHIVWKRIYTFIPGVLMCYLLPSLLVSAGIVSDNTSNLYFMASRYLLPAALVLMTLSIDIKAIASLGSKALIMFFTGTFGIVLRGPIALL